MVQRSSAAVCLLACLAVSLAALPLAAGRMVPGGRQLKQLKSGVDTRFCIKVRRGISGVRLVPSELDNTDWGGDERPDHLFADVDLTPRLEPYCWGLNTNFWNK